MKMDLTLLLLAFTVFWKSCQSIKCFKCVPEKTPFGTSPPCSNFNYSNDFIVECSSSTMCFKRETTLVLGSVVTKSEERGCAAQTMSGDQRKVDGKWQRVNEVYEVYEESCKEHPSDYERATTTVHCYCRGDLCNNAVSIRISLGTLFAAFVWFLVS